MARRKGAHKINYFELLPKEIIEEILKLTIIRDLKDIGSIKKDVNF